MKPVLIAYAESDGVTRRIAGHVAESFAARDFETSIVDIATIEAYLELENYSGIVVLAVLHRGHHERAAVDLVKAHREALADVPAAFLSLNVEELDAEPVVTTSLIRAQVAPRVPAQMDRFFTEAEWPSTYSRPVAGAIVYSRYGWLVKWALRRSPRADATREKDFSDWEKLDDFVDEFVSKELSPTFKFKTL